MSLGADHSLAIKPDGSIWAAGFNVFGQLGIDPKKNMMMDDFVEVMSGDASAIAAGGKHSLVPKTDGSLWTAGSNECGQLGDGTKTDRHAFVKVMPGDVKSIATSAKHSLVVMRNGSVWATGCNRYGQLGDGSTSERQTFAQVIPKGGVSAAAAVEHSMVLKQDGSVWVTGNNKCGQLGWRMAQRL